MKPDKSVNTAYFELAHTDKVHGRTPFHDQHVLDKMECVHLCTDFPNCRSFNWNEDDERCQLVAYDRLTAPTYTDKTGWNNYDGGNQYYVHIETHSVSHIACYRGTGGSCSRDQVIQTYSSNNCDIDLNTNTFEYDPVLGVIRQMCGTKYLLAPEQNVWEDSNSGNPKVILQGPAAWSSDVRMRWRRVHYGISYWHYCLYMWGDGATGSDQALEIGNCYHNHHAIQIHFVHAPKPPVKVTVFTNIGVHSTMDSVLAHTKIVNNNYDRIGYSDGFVQQTWGETYFLRMEALFVAPDTGSFKFKLNVDDIGRVSISTDENAANKNTILDDAGTNPDTAPREIHIHGWDFVNYGKESTAVSLTKGMRYYIEVLMYEWGGADFIQMAMLCPSSTEYEFVETNYLNLIESEWET
eukprot:TCONS_00016889-protein